MFIKSANTKIMRIVSGGGGPLEPPVPKLFQKRKAQCCASAYKGFIFHKALQINKTHAATTMLSSILF